MSDGVAVVESRILVIRSQKVLLDSDLASLYQVETKVLNKAVSRNRDRFPDDFMFQLTPDEVESLRFQSGTSNEGRGGRRYRPYAFTEQGIAMLSGVLTSKRAVEVNVAIMRTFVRLRQLLATHEELARRLDQLEWRQSEQDGQVQYVFETIQQLIEAPAPAEPKRSIGFPTSQLAESCGKPSASSTLPQNRLQPPRNWLIQRYDIAVLNNSHKAVRSHKIIVVEDPDMR